MEIWQLQTKAYACHKRVIISDSSYSINKLGFIWFTTRESMFISVRATLLTFKKNLKLAIAFESSKKLMRWKKLYLSSKNFYFAGEQSTCNVRCTNFLQTAKSLTMHDDAGLTNTNWYDHGDTKLSFDSDDKSAKLLPTIYI